MNLWFIFSAVGNVFFCPDLSETTRVDSQCEHKVAPSDCTKTVMFRLTAFKIGFVTFYNLVYCSLQLLNLAENKNVL